MANELKVPEIKDAVGILNATLQKKLDALKAELSQYDGNVVTAANEKDMKKVRADLNRDRLSYDRERKDVVKAWKGQVKPIEDTYKSINGEYQKRIDCIDEQVQELEEKRCAEKQAVINTIFEAVKPEKGGPVTEWLTLPEIQKPQWMNKGYTIKDIQQEIEDAFWNLNQDYSAITRLGSKWEDKALEILKSTKSYREASNYIADMTTKEQLILERQRKEEEAKRRAEEEARIREEERRKREEAEAKERAIKEAIERARAEERARIEKEEADRRALEEQRQEVEAMDSIVAELPSFEEEELPPVEELPPIEELPSFEEEEFPLKQFRVTMIVEAEDYDNFLMMLEQSEIGATIESFEEV